MNRKLKLAIVGSGNAGCITAMHFYFYGRDIFDIEIYHDPNSPIEKVGQAAALDIPKLIHDVFDLDWINQSKYLRATRKDGIMYENWGKKVDKFTHSFCLSDISFHYVPELLSKLVLESGFFKVIEKNISNPEIEIDCDFIIDCRGRHDRDKDLYENLINPLNSVIVGKKNNPDISLSYTRSVATPDGWTFVIPNYDSVSYGYLYNRNITDKEVAEKNIKNIFDVDPIFGLDFENYIAKNCYYGQRTFLNGNRLSFLEPLEATSSSFYSYAARCFWDHIVDKVPKDTCNVNLRKEMKKIETFILWHYQKGSKYDTPFWDYAKSLPFFVDTDFQLQIDKCKSGDMISCKRNSMGYSQWGTNSFKYWVDNTYEE